MSVLLGNQTGTHISAVLGEESGCGEADAVGLAGAGDDGELSLEVLGRHVQVVWCLSGRCCEAIRAVCQARFG